MADFMKVSPGRYSEVHSRWTWFDRDVVINLDSVATVKRLDDEGTQVLFNSGEDMFVRQEASEFIRD